MATAWIVFWFLAPRGFADGKAFSTVAVSTAVTMPDQRALLVWSNGVERLAIETRIVGEGTNFAWAVPLPSAPRVEAGSVGLFPTLAWLTPPRLVTRAEARGLLVLCALGLAWLLLRVRKSTPVEWMDPVAILAVCSGYLGIGESGSWFGLAIPAVVFAAWGVWRVRRGEPGWAWSGGIALFLVLATLVFAWIFPVMHTASAGHDLVGTEGQDGVQILDRQVAGVFESTTVAAQDPAALEGWLKTNGYRMAEAARPVIEAHVRDGWVFVASRVRRDVAVVGPQALHPLVFTFATPKPVYPLRLTGVENGPLEVELYVLGPGRARVAGFELMDARPAIHPQPTSDSRELGNLSRSDFNVLHPMLRALASEAPFATRLRATLSPEQMRKDAIVEWDGAERFEREVYSTQAAVLKCVIGFGGAWLGGMVLLAAVLRFRPSMENWLNRLAVGSLALAAGVAVIGFHGLPTVSVRPEIRNASRFYRDVAEGVFFEAAQNLDRSGTLPSVESLRVEIRKVAGKGRLSPGASMMEEDSPRNYIVRAILGDVEMVYFDDFGQAFPRRVSEMRRKER